MSFSAVGQVFDLPAFRQHVAGLDLSWAKGVCLHHTAYPDLSMRPKGWTVQHMRNLASYYGGELKWHAGPHLFTDEDQVFGLSPLTAPGVHAVSFNRTHIGIEALGNYDGNDYNTERGVAVWETTVRATAILLARLGLEADNDSVKFHRDDPRTSKTCPGSKIAKAPMVESIAAELALLRGLADREDDPPGPPVIQSAEPSVEDRLASIEWQISQIRKSLP